MSTPAKIPAPPYDPEMAAILGPALNQGAPMPGVAPTLEFIQARRPGLNAMRAADIKALRENPALHFEERSIPGPHGDIPITIIRPAAAAVAASTGPRPGIVFYHGGGMTMGDVFLGVDAEYVAGLGAVVVTVDYRLAPEHRDLVLVEDCYAALKWVGANTAELDIDPARLMLAGGSAGGGLAAGTALMVRDKGGPALCGLLLKCPMLDDRNDTVSAQQYFESGTYTTFYNIVMWKCVLGDRQGGPDVSPYVAPGRATDLSNLPETFIDVGSAEPFRDEAVAFANRIWAAGGQAELHVWPGGTHGFGAWAPTADLSKWCREATLAWMRRRFVAHQAPARL